MLLGIANLLSFSYADRLQNVLPIEDIYDENSCPNISKVYLDQDLDGDTLWDF
jgi:hypothetical protein